MNRPVSFNDPTGHMQSGDAYTSNDGKCDAGDTSCNWVGKDRKAKSGDKGDNTRSSGNGSLRGSGNGGVTPEGLSLLASEATGFDVAAYLANLAFAVPADVIMLVYPPSIPAVEAAYQPYSVLPNMLSSVATVMWAMEGIRTGQTTISVNLESSGTGDFSTTNIINGTKISFSLDQDTAVSVATNTAGWTVLKEVNAATIVDGGVVLYDVGRNSKVVPAVNPTVSYHASSGGWDFSWFPK